MSRHRRTNLFNVLSLRSLMCSPLKRMLCNWWLLALHGSQGNRDFRSGARLGLHLVHLGKDAEEHADMPEASRRRASECSGSDVDEVFHVHFCVVRDAALERERLFFRAFTIPSFVASWAGCE